MPTKLAPLSVSAPGFYGLNKQNSGSNLDIGWADDAINCIIDEDGRLASRKGWSQTTTTPISGTPNIDVIFEYINIAGTAEIISAANNKIYSGTMTLTDISGTITTPTDDNWKFINFNGKVLGFQDGHTPIVKTTGNFADITAGAGTLPTGGAALSAFGRVWAVSSDTDKTVIKYSDLLDETTWSGGSSGSLDVKSVWGGDVITALAEFNGFLVIFGKKTILIYSGADDPSTMSLKDNLSGIGCIARDSVQDIGTDMLFYSDSGVRTLSRTVQADGSAPVGDISKNIRDYLASFVGSETPLMIRSVYHEPDGMYVINFPTVGYSFYFNLKYPNPDGSARATTWRSINPKAFCSSVDGNLYMGFAGVIGTYTGYLDNASTYDMVYWSAWNDFGEELRPYTKMPKKAVTTIVGGSGYTITYKWAFDYISNFVSQDVAVTADVSAAQYNISEYSNAEYSGGDVFSQNTVNMSGSGKVFKLGFVSTINNSKVSFQKIDIYAKLGRII